MKTRYGLLRVVNRGDRKQRKSELVVHLNTAQGKVSIIICIEKQFI